MSRARPTSNLILNICGHDTGLLSSIHHGLYEVSLRGFYPYLDLNEFFAFSASQWKGRENDASTYQKDADITLFEPDIHEIFTKVFSIGMPWLNKHKVIPDELRKKYERQNPYNGKDLAARLSQVSDTAVSKLLDDLSKPVNQYVFECQYEQEKALRGGDNFGLVVMNFQPAYPSKKNLRSNFALEIGRIIENYISSTT
jgi:hypothetical protein